MDRIQVEDVEPPDDRSVQQHSPDALERRQRAQQRDHPLRSVRPVDADGRDPGPFQVLRKGDDDRRDRGPPVPACERAVVDGRDPRVGLPERPP